MLLNRHLFKLDPDALTGSGSATADAAGAEASTPAAETADSDGTQKPAFTQADLDRILADRLSRQEKKLRRELEEQADKAKEEELADAAEWQTLAEKRQKQIAKLEEERAALQQQAAVAEKYGTALTGYVERLSANLPPEITALLENMDAADRLAWLSANAEKFAKATEAEAETNGAAKRPLPSTPPPTSGAKITPEERRRKAARTF